MSGTLEQPTPDRAERATLAHELRLRACTEPDRGNARSVANGEELAYGNSFGGNFHKGLPHDANGFVDAAAYRDFCDALLEQDHARFEGLPVGENFPSSSIPRRTTGGSSKHRKLTSPFTGHVYDLQGTDAAALALDAAPVLASDELAAEMAELYAMALLRDRKFEDIASGAGAAGPIAAALQGMPWFSGGTAFAGPGARRRAITGPADLFRGSTAGSHNGPWLSQFLLVGNRGAAGADTSVALHLRAKPEVDDGLVYYGTQVVDQRSATALPGNDWMQTWAAWLDAQNGVDFNGLDLIDAKRSFITTPRDIATYVHYDALYQAYQVACLMMLGGGAPFGFDRGMPESHSRSRSAFASYGGPHVLSLVTEVATRALKLVWRQKWLHHRRTRPEVVAGLLTLHANNPGAIADAALNTALAELLAKIPASILSDIAAKNAADIGGPTASAGMVPPNGNTAGLPTIAPGQNYLLPMAFPEGSPTHPAYGAGHATVAGACVTALKAFFEMYQADGVTELPWPLAAGQGPGGSGAYGFGKVFVGNHANLKKAVGTPQLTLQGELDKLAANIAIARNFAGVHYYTDYFASMRMGERLTVSILQDQAGLYNERMSMSFTSFDGDRVRVSGQAGQGSVSVVDRAGHAVDTEAWFQRYG